MAQVELTATAVEDLDTIIQTHSLPADTKERVRRALEPLQDFPRLGPALPGRWQGNRFLLGPWRWLIMVYALLDDDRRVVVLTIQDARSARAPTEER